MPAMLPFLVWLTLGLGIVTVVLRFLAWYGGTESERAIKDRLTDWYVYVTDGDWSRVIDSAAKITDGFLSSLFGPRLVSLKGILIWPFITGFVLVGILVVRGSGDIFAPDTLPYAAVVTLATSAIDYAALAVSRAILRRFRSVPVTPARAARFLVSIGAVTYLVIGFTLAMFAWSAEGLSSIDALWSQFTPHRMLELLEQFALWPWKDIVLVNVFFIVLTTHDFFVLVLPACLTTLLFVLVTGTASLVFIARPVITAPLSRILERLAETSNVTAAVATALTALSGIATLIVAVLKIGQ